MALMPKRVRHRKSQRGRIKGKAQRGNRVVFGDFGLQALQGGWIKAQTIESGRIAAQQYVRGEGRLYIRIGPKRSFHRQGHEYLKRRYASAVFVLVYVRGSVLCLFLGLKNFIPEFS